SPLSPATHPASRARQLPRAAVGRRAGGDDPVRQCAFALGVGSVRGAARRPCGPSLEDASFDHRRHGRIPALLAAPFPEPRADPKAAGASLNDAFLAALLGAYRMYHEELGHPIRKMPMAIPINVRREGDAEGGNRFAAARFSGPVGITDPRGRMDMIGALVRAARDEPAIDGLAFFTPLLARLPAPLISRLA